MDPQYAPTNGLNGLNGHDTPAEPTPTVPVDTNAFKGYLLALLPPLIGADPTDLESIFDEEYDDRVSRFATEPNTVLYVVKEREELEGVFSRSGRASALNVFSR